MAFAAGPFDEHLISRGRVDGEGSFSFPGQDPVYHGEVVDGRYVVVSFRVQCFSTSKNSSILFCT